jgi:hypothetical protein
MRNFPFRWKGGGKFASQKASPYGDPDSRRHPPGRTGRQERKLTIIVFSLIIITDHVNSGLRGTPKLIEFPSINSTMDSFLPFKLAALSFYSFISLFPNKG